MRKFLKSKWGARFLGLLYIGIITFLLGMNHQGANVVIAFLTWSPIIASFILLFFMGSEMLKKELYEDRETVNRYLKVDQPERMLYILLLACILMFHGWAITGIAYFIFRLAGDIAIRTVYSEVLKSKGEIPLN